MSPTEMPLYVDIWLLNETFTIIHYVPGRTKQTKELLLTTLTRWSLQFKTVPSSIGPSAISKQDQEVHSKRVLAAWVKDHFSTALLQQGSVFIGCGTTTHEAWYSSLRSLFLNNDSGTRLYTNNGFILHNEKEQKKGGYPYVPLTRVGTRYIREYAAWQCPKPASEFPKIGLAIISVAGCKFEKDTLELRVFWEELQNTIKQVFIKTSRQIVIIAAGRKLVESEGSKFIDLLPLVRKRSSQGRRLTFAVDTNVKEDIRTAFNEKVALLSKIFGTPVKSKRYPVIYWNIYI
jgi:hypothetical protein